MRGWKLRRRALQQPRASVVATSYYLLVKTLVLDTTELRRDWMFRGMTSQILAHAVSKTINTVAIPAPVLEELVAHHARESAEARARLERTVADNHRLGLATVAADSVVFDYRNFVLERWDERLGFSVLPWPTVEHSALVFRAVNRLAPFDEKGGGYRDALVWASALELAGKGADVVLVSADRAFSDGGDRLAPSLMEEFADLPGSIELVRDLAPWLLSHLPWGAETIAEAVILARDEAFVTYFLESDLQDELSPDAEAVGFDTAPYFFRVAEVDWDGSCDRVSTRPVSDGASIAEYDIGEIVEFVAEVSDRSRIEPGWDTERASSAGRLVVKGRVNLVLRVGVFFENDSTFSFEDLSWRRADGVPPGPGVDAAKPGVPLFDL